MLVKKRSLARCVICLILLPTLYYFINFDHSQNLDIGGYKDSYENAWNQFELGYTFLEGVSRYLSISFDDFWFLLICLELVLIALLYSNPVILIIAFPNLLFLSQGLLGTQVRFGIASLLCLLVFKVFFVKRPFYIYSGVTALFHNGTIIFHFLSFFLKVMIDVGEKITKRKNITRLIFLIVFLFFISFFVRYILLFLGYYYYDAASKHMVMRSISSLVYTGVVLVFTISLLNSRFRPVSYAPMVYLGTFMLIVSLIFYNFSIISGRYNLVYMLIEPFILYSYFKAIGMKKGFGFISFLIFYSVTISKLATINLVV